MTNPVALWIKYLSQVFPDPGIDSNPVISPGGSITSNEFPRHHGTLNDFTWMSLKKFPQVLIRKYSFQTNINHFLMNYNDINKCFIKMFIAAYKNL